MRIWYSRSVKDYSQWSIYFKEECSLRSIYWLYFSSLRDKEMEKFFEAVSHKNTRPFKLQLQGNPVSWKNKTNKQTQKSWSQWSLQTSVCSDTEPEQVWVSQICCSSLQISCESQILLKLQLLVSVWTLTPSLLDSCQLCSDLLEKQKN